MQIKTALISAAVFAVTYNTAASPLAAAPLGGILPVPQTRELNAPPLSTVPVVATGPIVKRIKFIANTPDRQPSVRVGALEWVMETKEGQAYSADVLAHDLDRLFNLRTGFFRAEGLIAEVGPGVNFNSNTGVLTIPIVEAYISHITITGNSKTPTPDILKQVHAQPGDVLDEDVVQQDMTRIYETKQFAQVGPYQIVVNNNGFDDVIVPVVEK